MLSALPGEGRAVSKSGFLCLELSVRSDCWMVLCPHSGLQPAWHSCFLPTHCFPLQTPVTPFLRLSLGTEGTELTHREGEDARAFVPLEAAFCLWRVGAFGQIMQVPCPLDGAALRNVSVACDWAPDHMVTCSLTRLTRCLHSTPHFPDSLLYWPIWAPILVSDQASQELS